MDSQRWWDPIEVPSGESRSLELGRTALLIEHDPHEWRLSCTPEHPREPSAVRIATTVESSTIVLHPLLTNLPVVARLEAPVHIASGDECTIFVGSALGANIEIGPPDGQQHGELRFFEPPKTWFGPNTRTGEICFASRTWGRLRREAIEHHLDRAITAIHVMNVSDAPLVFERVRIPVPNLSLFQAADGTLWTSRVRVEYESATEPALGDVEDGPPTALDLDELTELAAPREPLTSLLSRAIGAVLPARSG